MTPRDNSADRHDHPRDGDGRGGPGRGGRGGAGGPRRGLLTTLFAVFFIAYWLLSTFVFTRWVNDVGGFVWGWGILALPLVVPLYAVIQRLAFRRPAINRHRWLFLLLICVLTGALYPAIAAGIATVAMNALG
ncbi:hypothetical protein C882_2160 [Caenispirillum salinarum AK4]|uniref:Uncharacterized protein n=1 Tax=Caenispirillum salinarum AK4 TaxID=1238182 RepID=K9HDW8_9PROT|nr:hypothetical protein [Caenispirillum salinarum]EKV26936.1 hypothetical protein C882_2160 [Caenispirillum salinarum AK4]